MADFKVNHYPAFAASAAAVATAKAVGVDPRTVQRAAENDPQFAQEWQSRRVQKVEKLLDKLADVQPP